MTDPTQASPAARRPELSPFVLNALVATYMLAICNTTIPGHPVPHLRRPHPHRVRLAFPGLSGR